MGRLKPVLQFWILCNYIIMTMAGTYSMSITHICLVLSHLSLCYITSSVPLPNLSLTFVILYLESYCASHILHLFLSNILLLHCTVSSSSYPPSCLPSAKVLDAEAGDIALLHPTYHCFTLPHWNRCCTSLHSMFVSSVLSVSDISPQLLQEISIILHHVLDGQWSNNILLQAPIL